MLPRNRDPRAAKGACQLAGDMLSACAAERRCGDGSGPRARPAAHKFALVVSTSLGTFLRFCRVNGGEGCLTNLDPRAAKGVCRLDGTFWVRLRPSGDTVTVLWQVGRPCAWGFPYVPGLFLGFDRVVGVQGPRSKGDGGEAHQGIHVLMAPAALPGGAAAVFPAVRAARRGTV